MKKETKGLGAWFNGDIKKWYVRPGMDIEPFKKWIPRTSGRCGVYFLTQIYLLGALVEWFKWQSLFIGVIWIDL